MSTEVRVRFAPSPTGPLHIGGVRTALYNYLFAKKHGGKFLLRVEDTDQTRYVAGAETYIVEALEWAGIPYDEGPGKEGDCGPYRQSERMGMYKQYADKLVADGNAYYAFDTPEELVEMRERLKAQGVPSPQYNQASREYMKNSIALSADEVQKRMDEGQPYVVRLKIPRNEEIKVFDEIRGWVVVNSNQIDDKVMLKADGMPTYHLANVVDDYNMKISHVIRGEEWLPSAPLHVLTYKFFGWEDVMPKFAHLPLILRPDGNGKLSKRDGDQMGFPVFPLDWDDSERSNEMFSGFREAGFLPDAFINMLAFLGWNPGIPQEIFSLSELIETFTLERVGKAGAKFDFEKAKWFNQQHIKLVEDDVLAGQFKEQIEQNGVVYNGEFTKQVVSLVKDRLTFLHEFWEHSNYFWVQPASYDEDAISKKWSTDLKPYYESIASLMESLETWNAEQVEKTCKAEMEAQGVKPGQVMQLLRVCISGGAAGPPLFDSMALLGKSEVAERIRKAIAHFESR